MDRLLVIDADLNPRIASELRKRGRAAKSLQQLGWKAMEDPEMVRAVFGRLTDPVLVTTDDNMPADHPEVLNEVQATVATIEPWELHPASVVARDAETSVEETYEREVVHRWAQAMQTQTRGTTKRYFLGGARAWKRRR